MSAPFSHDALLLLQPAGEASRAAVPGEPLVLLSHPDGLLPRLALSTIDGAVSFTGAALPALSAAVRELSVASVSAEAAPDGSPLARVSLRVPLALTRGLSLSCKPATLSFLMHACADPDPDPVPSPAPLCGFAGCAQHAPSPPAASLRALFDELPFVRARLDGREAHALHSASPAAPCPLAALSSDLLVLVLDALDSSADLRAAACTCRALSAASFACRPRGLAVELFEHQRAALYWLLQRESRPARCAHWPHARAGCVAGTGTPVVVDALERRLRPGWEEAPREPRGGIYADEPGMGKTVTALALLLRTRGALPAPPRGEAAAVGPDGVWRYAPRREVQSGRRSDGAAPPRGRALSPATLIVVPGPLLEHWEEQAALRAPAARLALLREERATRAGEAEGVRLLCAADLVLTSFERLSSSLRGGRGPLFSVRFLRILLDEGHSLASSALTERHENALRLDGERRWVMTGTPGRERAGARLAAEAGLLQPLFAFLRCPLLGARAQWASAVGAGLAAEDGPARAAALRLLRGQLSRLVSRAAKSDLPRLSRLRQSEVLLDFEPSHGRAYNAFVLFAQRTMFLADLYDERHAQHLLNSKQAKEAGKTVRNLVLACNVTGDWKPRADEKQVQDGLRMLLDAEAEGWRGMRPAAHHAPGWAPPPAAALEAAAAAWRRGGACARCATQHPFVLVSPCAAAHILCLGCADSAGRAACPVCASPYALEERNGCLIPQDLIELQPVIELEWTADAGNTRSSKVSHVLRTMRDAHPAGWEAAERRARRRAAAVAAAVSSVRAAAARAVEEAAAAAGGVPPFAAPAQRAALEKQYSDAVLAALAEDAAGEEEAAEAQPPPPHSPPPPKFILYSRFTEHLQLFAQHLALCGWGFAWLTAGGDRSRDHAVRAFKHDPLISVLLMDDTGSVGHDLSCASHVFLLEPLRDAALEQQVVSRAWRLGCPHATVRVETLAMRGTAEQRVLELRQGSAQAAAENRALLLGLQQVTGRRAAACEDVCDSTRDLDEASRFLLDVYALPAQAAKLAQMVARRRGARATASRTPAKAEGGRPSRR